MEIKFQQTPNYAKGSTQKIGYVIHGTLGAYKGAVDWLCNANRTPRSSAHYVIGRNQGEIIQLVKDEDIAWHAGIVSNPTDRAKKVLRKNLDGTYENPNKYLIGIEMVWGYDINGDGKINAYDKTLTDWQYSALYELIQSKMDKVPFKPENILTHTDIASYKGDNLSDVVLKVCEHFGHEETVTIEVKKSQLDKILQYIKTL